MDEIIKILVVEDEMLIGAKLSMHLTDLGYHVSGIIPRGKEAIIHVDSNLPDLILMDINLNGTLDGVETARKIKAKHNIPIIFLTANADSTNFERAKTTKPEAFISKPYKPLDLQRAIELCFSRISDEPIENDPNLSFLLEDRIFVKLSDKRVKLFIKDIFYIESDRNYSKIYSRDKNFTLAVTLKNLQQKLPSQYFLRVHRSFIVNCSSIDEVSDAYVIINKKIIPIGKTYRNELMERLRLI